MSATMEHLRWLCGRDTGVSSATIWRVMTGEEPEQYRRADRPLDYDDLGRCIRLLDLFPEWRARLAEVSERHPRWAPLVAEWSRLEEAHRRGDYVVVGLMMRGLYAHRCCCGDYVSGGGPAGERHRHGGCDSRVVLAVGP